MKVIAILPSRINGKCLCGVNPRPHRINARATEWPSRSEVTLAHSGAECRLTL